MNHDNPLSVADNCDPEDAFEVSCRRHIRSLHAENAKLRAVLLRQLIMYRVDDDAFDKRAEAERLLNIELARSV